MPDAFDAWVVRAVLNPARPLFREARYLLAEEPDLHDTASYHSVLTAGNGPADTRRPAPMADTSCESPK